MLLTSLSRNHIYTGKVPLNHISRSPVSVISSRFSTGEETTEPKDDGKEEVTKGRKKSKKTLSRKPLIIAQRARNAALEQKASSMGLGWRIIASTVLHRYPVIQKQPEQWELDMERVQNDIDDVKRKAFVEQVAGTPADLMTADNPTYEEILKTMPFEPAPRITADDIANNRRSMDRNLDKSMYLIVKRNRESNSWQFPQGKLMDKEMLRSGSERVLDRAVGKVHRWFLSNGPIAHYCYEYPPEMQKQRNQFGAKVYFLRSQYYSGTLKLETKLYKDYAWVSRDEALEYFPEEMKDFVHAMLVE